MANTVWDDANLCDELKEKLDELYIKYSDENRAKNDLTEQGFNFELSLVGLSWNMKHDSTAIEFKAFVQGHMAGQASGVARVIERFKNAGYPI